jgi:hypothetical protein
MEKKENVFEPCRRDNIFLVGCQLGYRLSLVFWLVISLTRCSGVLVFQMRRRAQIAQSTWTLLVKINLHGGNKKKDGSSGVRFEYQGFFFVFEKVGAHTMFGLFLTLRIFR